VRKEDYHEDLAITLLNADWLLWSNDAPKEQQSTCKVCATKQRACMKNYADDVQDEYQM